MNVAFTDKTVTITYDASDYLGADNGPRLSHETYSWAGHYNLRKSLLDCLSVRRSLLSIPAFARDDSWVERYEQNMDWRSNILDIIRETLPLWRSRRTV